MSALYMKLNPTAPYLCLYSVHIANASQNRERQISLNEKDSDIYSLTKLFKYFVFPKPCFFPFL